MRGSVSVEDFGLKFEYCKGCGRVYEKDGMPMTLFKGNRRVNEVYFDEAPIRFTASGELQIGRLVEGNYGKTN